MKTSDGSGSADSFLVSTADFEEHERIARTNKKLKSLFPAILLSPFHDSTTRLSLRYILRTSCLYKQAPAQDLCLLDDSLSLIAVRTGAMMMMMTMTQKTFHFRPDQTVQDDDGRTDRQSVHLKEQQGTYTLTFGRGPRSTVPFFFALLFNQRYSLYER